MGEIVPISNPDFKDFSSLLTKLATEIGFPELQGLPPAEKETKILDILKTFPALIVIDDLDSLDWSSDVETMAFITYSLPHSQCKVMIDYTATNSSDTHYFC